MAESVVRLADIIAEAYHSTASLGADMHAVVDVLEPLRASLQEARDLAEVEVAVNTVLADCFPDATLCPVLSRLRDTALGSHLSSRLNDLEMTAERNSSGAGRVWLELVADAWISLNADWLERLGAWATAKAIGDPDLAALVVTQAPLLRSQRFSELLPIASRLAGEELPSADTRCQLLVMQAQIVLYHLTDMPEVRRLLAAAEAVAPENPRPLLLRASIAGKRIEWAVTEAERHALLAEAHQDFDNLLDRAADDVKLRSEALNERADLHLRAANLTTMDESGRTEKEEINAAVAAVEEAITLTPWDGGCYRNLAGHLVRQGARPGDARIRQLSELAALLEPRFVSWGEMAMGNALFDAGLVDDALASWDRVVAAVPDHLMARLGRIAVLQSRGDYIEARRLLDEVEELNPESFEAVESRAWLCEAEQEWERAVVYYTKALERRPQAEAAVRANIAYSLSQLGRNEEARQHARMACQWLLARGDREGPTTGAATQRLIDAVDVSGAADLTSALADLELVHQLRGESYTSEYKNRCGVLYYSSGHHAEAVEQYRAAIAADGSVARYYYNLGLALYSLDDLDGALKTAELGHAIDGDDAKQSELFGLVYNLRGVHAQADGDLETAVAWYRQAVAEQPNNAVIVSNLAEGLSATLTEGDALLKLREAAQLLERAAELAPDTYAEGRDAARARLSAAEEFGPFLFTMADFRRCRIKVSSDLLEVIVNESRQLKPEVIERMQRRPDGPYGIKRPAVGFLEEFSLPPGTVAVVLNGQHVSEIGVVNSFEPMIAELERAIDAQPEALLGPDEVVLLLLQLDRAEVVKLLDDPEWLVDITRFVREQAAEHRDLAEIVEEFLRRSAPVGAR